MNTQTRRTTLLSVTAAITFAASALNSARADDLFACSANTTGGGAITQWNPLSGETKPLGAFNIPGVQDVALSHAGWLVAATRTQLYTIERPSGRAAPLGGPFGLTTSMTGMDFTDTGRLYGLDADGRVFSIDPATGAATLVLTTAFRFAGDLAHKEGKVFLATTSAPEGSHLVRLDLGDNTASDLGVIAPGHTIQGLDFDGPDRLLALNDAAPTQVFAITDPDNSGAGMAIGPANLSLVRGLCALPAIRSGGPRNPGEESRNEAEGGYGAEGGTGGDPNSSIRLPGFFGPGIESGRNYNFGAAALGGGGGGGGGGSASAPGSDRFFGGDTGAANGTTPDTSSNTDTTTPDTASTTDNNTDSTTTNDGSSGGDKGGATDGDGGDGPTGGGGGPSSGGGGGPTIDGTPGAGPGPGGGPGPHVGDPIDPVITPPPIVPAPGAGLLAGLAGSLILRRPRRTADRKND